jgi:hypothetical protein
MEGASCFEPSTGCDATGLVLPVHVYSQNGDCSITGGYVYRGSTQTSLVGHYFYADYCSGWIRSFRMAGGVATDHFTRVSNVGNITSFGEDAAGELYVMTAQGNVYRIAEQPAAP